MRWFNTDSDCRNHIWCWLLVVLADDVVGNMEWLVILCHLLAPPPVTPTKAKRSSNALSCCKNILMNMLFVMIAVSIRCLSTYMYLPSLFQHFVLVRPQCCNGKTNISVFLCRWKILPNWWIAVASSFSYLQEKVDNSESPAAHSMYTTGRNGQFVCCWLWIFPHDSARTIMLSDAHSNTRFAIRTYEIYSGSPFFRVFFWLLRRHRMFS